MFKYGTIATLVTSLIACSSGMQATQTTANMAQTIDGVVVRSVSLDAREEQQLPPGQSPTANREIGFAAVFVQLENTQNAEISLNIQKIEIRDAVSGSVQLATTSPQVIRLRPLENAVNDFHLTNRIGYRRGDRVKAVITLQVNGETRVIESDTVVVERY